MSKEIEKIFDYSGLSVEDQAFVKVKEQAIKSRTTQTIINNGRDLLEVKERLQHGQFMEWCKCNFPWKRQTIQNMMNVADKLPNLGNLDITKTALYLLAESSTPETARQEAIKKAEAGEKIDLKTAKKLKEAHSLIKQKDKQLKQQEEQFEKTSQELLQSQERIAKLRQSIQNLKQQEKPDKKTLQEIENLKKELEREKKKKKPTNTIVEVPPEDYEKIKQELKKKEDDLKNNRIKMERQKTQIDDLKMKLNFKEEIQDEKVMSKRFEEAYESFFAVITAAKLENWEKTPKKTVINCLFILNNFVEN